MTSRHKRKQHRKRAHARTRRRTLASQTLGAQQNTGTPNESNPPPRTNYDQSNQASSQTIPWSTTGATKPQVKQYIGQRPGQPSLTLNNTNLGLFRGWNPAPHDGMERRVRDAFADAFEDANDREEGNTVLCSLERSRRILRQYVYQVHNLHGTVNPSQVRLMLATGVRE